MIISKERQNTMERRIHKITKVRDESRVPPLEPECVVAKPCGSVSPWTADEGQNSRVGNGHRTAVRYPCKMVL